MPKIYHRIPLIVKKVEFFLSGLLPLSGGRIAAQWIPIIPRGASPPTLTEISMNFLFLVITLRQLPWMGSCFQTVSYSLFLWTHSFLLAVTALSPLIKSSCCWTLASLSYFPFSSDLPHFWSPACKAVMIFSFSFWESLLYCLAFNYKISLENSQSFIWQYFVFSQSGG